MFEQYKLACEHRVQRLDRWQSIRATTLLTKEHATQGVSYHITDKRFQAYATEQQATPHKIL
jgi:hypothetical protein